MAMTNPDKDNISSLNSDVSASANSNADVGLSQRGRIVDTVTDHSHHVTTLL